MTLILESSKEQALTAEVLVVDDQPTSRVITEAIVRGVGDNITVRGFESSAAALAAIQAGWTPDLIIADYRMPGMNGVELTQRVRRHPGCHDVPIMIITIVDDREVMYNALEAGATDFLLKPVDHYECKVRCRNLLTLRRQQIIIRNRASSLESRIRVAVGEARLLEREILMRLARVGEFRDGPDGRHQVRVGQLAARMASHLGLPASFRTLIEFAAPLHDVGKIAIPDSILMKAGRLTAGEWDIMRNHAHIGHQILCDSSSPFLQMGAVIALTHHERLDGSGYPQGLSGDHIPIEGRIVAVADMFDTLCKERPYRAAWSAAESLREVRRLGGSHLDAGCVEALLRCVNADADIRTPAAASQSEVSDA